MITIEDLKQSLESYKKDQKAHLIWDVSQDDPVAGCGSYHSITNEEWIALYTAHITSQIEMIKKELFEDPIPFGFIAEELEHDLETLEEKLKLCETKRVKRCEF